MNQQKAERLVSIKQASEITGISYPTLHKWVKSGRLISYFLPNRKCGMISLEQVLQSKKKLYERI